MRLWAGSKPLPGLLLARDDGVLEQVRFPDLGFWLHRTLPGSGARAKGAPVLGYPRRRWSIFVW